jgi:hypothetical protein
MIVKLARRAGDSAVLEQIGGDLLFEGGAVQEGVLVTFQLDDREFTGRVINVADQPDKETVVKIELIDQAAQTPGARSRGPIFRPATIPRPKSKAKPALS